MNICLIGNSGTQHNLKDGQTIKLQLYKKKMVDEGCAVSFVDLENFFRRFTKIRKQIKKAIKCCDRIVLISGERACRLLIPFINRINREYEKPFILPVVGTGLLHYHLNELDQNSISRFFEEKDFSYSRKDRMIGKQLSKISAILVETALLRDAYQKLYHVDNCVVLNNFRDIEINYQDVHNKNDPFKIVFLSRVARIKGIFDLLEATKSVKGNYILDIYGDKYFSNDEEKKFNRLLSKNVNYKGVVNMEEASSILSQYDLFAFPTQYMQEGTPGVVSESLIAGTPILVSSFPQVKYILKDGYDSIFFKMNDVEDLKRQLLWCILNKDKINNMRNNVSNSGKLFTYNHSRNIFLRYICGFENKM